MVRRKADPSGAVAMTIRHGFGSVASVTLARIVSARVSPGATVAPSHGSVVAVIEVDDSKAAEAAVRDLVGAVTRPVGPKDRVAIDEALAQSRLLPALGNADAGVAACKGELHRDEKPLPVTSSQAEKWRQAIAVSDVALAVVGDAPVVSAAARSLDATTRWRAVAPTAPPASQPSTQPPSSWEVSSRHAAVTTLHVAVQVASGNHGSGLRRFLEEDAGLARRAAGWPGGWRLQSLDSRLGAAGACVNLELEASGSVSPQQAATTSVLIDSEIDRALERSEEHRGSIAALALRQPSARSAATLASAAALDRQREDEGNRWGTVNGVEISPEWLRFSDLRNAALASRGERAFELRVADETNQAGLAVLLATPCSLGFESSGSSGATAVMLQAAALAADPSVTVVPWLAPHGTGLLAYSPPRDSESVREHAERVASALSAALASDADGASVARAVEALLGSVPSTPDQIELVYLLSGNRPSLLSSRGTTRTLTAISPVAVRSARSAFLSQPLRVAVLATNGRAQADDVERQLRRDLWPQHEASAVCPDSPSPEVIAGSYTVDTVATPDADATLGVVLTPNPGLQASAALDVLVRLMNESGGWLERHVTAEPELLGNVEVSLLEGTGAAALSFAVTAGPEQEVAPLVEQLRGLIERLADIDLGDRAKHALIELRRRAELSKRSPAFRARRLWLGKAAMTAPTEDDLRRILAALSKAPQVLVTVRNP